MSSDVVIRTLEPRSELSVKVTLPANRSWQTPGTTIAEAVRGLHQVRAVLELVNPDRLTVLVLLDDDPDDVLDAIFEAERRLYPVFRNLPFDVRVSRMHHSWKDVSTERQVVPRYLREP